MNETHPLPVLIVNVNDRCYTSYRFFAKELAAAIEHCGVPVRWCTMEAEAQGSEAAWGKLLENVCQEQYRAVIDFNSFLPKLQTGEHAMPEFFHAPFYNYILDHPLYHHKALSAKGFEQRVICVDQAHEEYIRCYYPQIREVMTQGIPASAGAYAELPFEHRQNRILFCGTYEPSDQYLKLLKQLPAPLKKEGFALIERMLAQPELTLEECLRDELEKQGIAQFGQQVIFPARMQADFLVDAYLRARRREEVIYRLTDSELPLTIYGQGWEKVTTFLHSGVELHEAVSYDRFVDLIGQYRFLLNSMPCFTRGGHDRIVQAMRNGTVCITDENRYVRDHYENHGNILWFSLKKPELLVSLCHNALRHGAEMERIAEAGRSYAERNHTWEQAAGRILEWNMQSQNHMKLWTKEGAISV